MRIPQEGSWTFQSSEIADGFDEHVQGQLPWYSLATQIAAHIGRHYIPVGGRVYDIGAATGNIGNALRETLDSRSAQLIAIDNSDAMRAAYKGPGEFIVADAVSFPYQPFDFGVVFLTAMFFPFASRRAWFNRLQDALRPGGALLIFDKTEPLGGYAGTVIYRLGLANKIASGVPADEILQKEMSLAGVQRPLAPCELPKNFVEVFRLGDFAGWLIEASPVNPSGGSSASGAVL